MPRFRGEFIDQSGQKRRESLEASDKAAALSALRTRAAIVLDLRASQPSSEFVQWLQDVFGGRRLSGRQLQRLSQTLATYLRAGIAVQEALRLTGAANPSISDVVLKIRAALAGGETIDQALRSSGYSFPQGFVALVRAGAESGTIPEVLLNEAKRLRTMEEIRRDLASSLIYPMALVVMCVLVITFMLAYIVPQIRASMTDEAVLAASTIPSMIFWASDTVQAISVTQLAVGIGLLGLFLVFLFRRSSDWRSRVALRWPLVGPITTSLATASFCYSLGTLLASSVRTERAWALAAASVRQAHFRRAFETAGERIVQGTPISVAAAGTGLLPEDAASVFALGERTGTLDRLLLEVGDFHASEALTKLKKLAGIVAPAVILLSGLLVGIFAVAMMSTILSVNQIYAG